MQVIATKISELTLYQHNPRIHEGAVERMAEIIKEFGFRVPILIKSDGMVIDGHLRVAAALLLELTEVPAIIVDDMSDAQIKALRIAANKSASFATWDFSLLADEMDMLKLEEIDLSITGFDAAEMDELFRMVEDPKGILPASSGTIQFKTTASVKVVLPLETLKSLEQAIAKTGENNRADAVKKICEVYLGSKR